MQVQVKYTIAFALASCTLLSGCLDSDASRAKKAAATATPAPTPVRETEWRTIEVNSQPQGAAIEVGDAWRGWQSVGYAPVSINVETFKDDGGLANYYLIRGIPTAPGEYQQYITLSSYNNVIFYMYNNAQ
jgi:hypothetical protein